VVEEEEEEAPAPAPAPKAKAVKAKPAPVVEPEEVEEPVVRQEVSKKPAAPAKGGLADMVSDWDDE
jgi:hypothetical protein